MDRETILTTKMIGKWFGFLVLKYNMSVNDFYLTSVNPNFNDELKRKKIVLFVGLNLRLESPILNIKVRKLCIKNEMLLLTLGVNFNENLNLISLGLNSSSILDFFRGKNKGCVLYFNKVLKSLIKKKFYLLDCLSVFNMMLIMLGNNSLFRRDFCNFIEFLNFKVKMVNMSSQECLIESKYYVSNSYIKEYFDLRRFEIINFCNKTKIYNIIYLTLAERLINELNFGDINIQHRSLNKNNIYYFLGEDLIYNLQYSKFLIFQGHNIGKDLTKFDIVLPSVNFLEKNSYFLNLEGKLCKANFILYPPYFCRTDWSILNAFYIYYIKFNSYFIYNKQNLNLTKFLSLNRFYLFINKRNLNIWIKKYSVNFFYSQLTTLIIYNYVFKLYNFCNINKLYKYLNSILNSLYYNPYNLDIFSLNSVTLRLSYLNYNKSIKNYT